MNGSMHSTRKVRRSDLTEKSKSELLREMSDARSRIEKRIQHESTILEGLDAETRREATREERVLRKYNDYTD